MAVTLLTCLIFISCAGSNNPVTSQLDNLTGSRDITTLGQSSHQFWGYWNVSIDPDTLEIDAVPLRSAEFTCNVTQFMQPPSQPTHQISFTVLAGSDPVNGYFEVDVTLRHPFPGINQYRGFDVKGLLISDGSYALQHDTTATYGGPGDTQLMNADGHSRWWNPTEFTTFGTIFGYTPGGLAPPVFPTATINPYKYFTDSIEYDEPVWSIETGDRGTFPTDPGIYTRPYFIQFAMDGSTVEFNFNYAVDASWELPDPDGAPDYDVDSYPLSANSAEPYCISVADIGSNAYYIAPDDFGGNLNLAVTVYDWQSVQNPGGLPAELSALWLDSPVLTTPVDILSTATILPDGPTSSVFEVSIGSLNLTQSGDEPMFVIAETSDGFGYEPQIAGGDMFDHPDAILSSYFQTSVTILDNGGGAPIVTSIDPNEGFSGEVLIDVLVGGENFANGAQVELRHDTWDTIEADNEVMSGAGTLITCDIDLDLAGSGLWDVVVINPDLLEGMLEDGFTVICPDAVHTYDDKYQLLSFLYYNYCQRGDLTILEAGQYAGDAVIKRAYTSDPDYTGYYVRFDPDNPTDIPEYDYFNVPGRSDGEAAYVTMTAQIDQNPANAHIGVVNGRMFDVVQVVDDGGNWVEDVKVDTEPETYPNKYPLIPGLDFDDEGDMWLVTDIRGEWYPAVEREDPIWQLRHYELQETAPYYSENIGDRLDITGDLTDSDWNSWAVALYVADIAISYTEDVMFVWAFSIQGINQSLFVKYDLSTSPPSYIETQDLVPTAVGCSNPYAGMSRADIEFDHTDLSLESCRLMVMYQTYSGTLEINLMRLDTDLNVLADEMVTSGMGAWDNPHAIAFNTDPSLRNLITIDMDSSYPYNDFLYFPMPTSGW